jgi:enamine deaminase RidA (YjgF/YER057c/UK114 family)
MSEIQRIESNARVSRVVIHNGVAYFSGLVAPNRSLDIKGQAQQVLDRLDEYLQKAGTTRSHLLSVQLWVKDMEGDISDLNEVWAEWFAGHEKPTRATAQVMFDEDDLRLELIATAAVPTK